MRIATLLFASLGHDAMCSYTQTEAACDNPTSSKAVAPFDYFRNLPTPVLTRC
jgi:hypothetical protein